MRPLPTFVVCLILAAAMSTAVAQDEAEDDGFRLQRINNVAPSYPRKAHADGIEGWVDLQLTVNPQGRVEDVTVLDAEPKQVFERAAIRAAVKWRFRPPEDAGITTNRSGRIRINFRLDG